MKWLCVLGESAAFAATRHSAPCREVAQTHIMAMEKNLLHFLAVRAAIGIGTGWAVLAAFIVLDVASLRTLMAMTGSTLPAMVLLAVFFAVTFGSCAMGLSIMAEDGRHTPKPPSRGRGIKLAPPQQPARAVVRPHRG
jgi:hypothetical protein